MHFTSKPVATWLVFSLGQLSLSSLFFFLLVDQPAVHCAVKFDLQELTHDCPVNNEKKILQVDKGEQLNYKLPTVEANRTIRLFLAKPYKVREAEFHSNDFTHMIVVNESSSPYIHIVNANAHHRGDYSLYRFEYDSNGTLVNYSRTDFYLVVEALSPEKYRCEDGGSCESGTCRLNKCLCKEQFPIYHSHSATESRCYSAKKLNESCELDEECQFMAGPNAECYRPWQKCRCNRHTVPTKILGGIRHCVTLAQLHSRCLYSKECSMAGDNRYCNATYRCDCLPGYRLEKGRFCSSAGFRWLPNALLQVLLVILPWCILYL